MFLGSSISSLDACRIHRSLSQGPQFTLYFVGHFAWLHHFVCLISRLFLLSLDACRIHQPLSQGLQFILFRFSDTPSLFGCTPNSSVLVTRTTIHTLFCWTIHLVTSFCLFGFSALPSLFGCMPNSLILSSRILQIHSLV
jgi:hypothetical protein